MYLLGKAIRMVFTGAVALLCMMIIVPMASAQAAGALDPNRINRATVWVDTYWDGIVQVDQGESGVMSFEATSVGYCTGFVVDGSGGIVTAGHCVEKPDNIGERLMQNVLDERGITDRKPADFNYKFSVESPTVVIGQPLSIKDGIFGNNGMTAQIIDYQEFEAGDNALLRIANFDTSSVATLPIADAPPEMLSEVTSVGYAGDTMTISELERTNPTYKLGRISNIVVSDKGVPNYQLDGEIIQGMSGGPTLNEAGEVVGVNSRVFISFSQSYITDTQTLRSFLTKNGVELKSSASQPSADMPLGSDSGAVAIPPRSDTLASAAQNSSDDDSGVPVWSWFVVGGLALVVVGGGVAWKVRQRRNPQSLKEQATE